MPFDVADQPHRQADRVRDDPLPGSPWFGYSPLDPAHVASTDGIVFVKDTRRS